jgi:hypothetical protein
MIVLTTIASAALLLAGTSAAAQDVPEPAAPSVPQSIQQQEVPPGDGIDPAHGPAQASPIPQTAFTDAQVAGFAAAAMEMRAIRADTSLDDAARRARAEALVAEHGLDRESYQAIGTAAQQDPALANRIQQAIEAQAQEPGE